MTDGRDAAHRDRTPDTGFTRLSRFAAGLWFLVATLLLALSGIGVFDFVRDCTWLPHLCFYLAFASPVLVVAAFVSGFAGYWLWTRTRDASIPTSPTAVRERT